MRRDDGREEMSERIRSKLRQAGGANRAEEDYVTTQEFDQGKAEEFAERMIGLLNGGALALMTSVGHRTGLFGIMAGLPPSTTEQIAAEASLNERYVRE